MTTGNDNQKMGKCVKCDSSIPVDAERCRECGYEPGPGILGGILGGIGLLIAFNIGWLFALIAVISLILIFDGFPVVDGLIVFLFTGGIGAVLLSIAYAGYVKFRSGQRRGPTDPPIGEREDDKSISESWQEGVKRGGASSSESWQEGVKRGDAGISVSQQEAAEWGDSMADKINQLGPAIVAVLPGWTWTVGVLLSVVLHLLLWVAAGQESGIGIPVGLFGGVIVSFTAILSDTKRLEWRGDGYSPRWWVWTIPGMVPFFGWIFGLLWLLRKRQKTGSVV